jgi:hypothetical protein
MPSNSVDPPLKMTFKNNSLRISLSHLFTESKQYLSIPSRSWPARVG